MFLPWLFAVATMRSTCPGPGGQTNIRVFRSPLHTRPVEGSSRGRARRPCGDLEVRDVRGEAVALQAGAQSAGGKRREARLVDEVLDPLARSLDRVLRLENSRGPRAQ